MDIEASALLAQRALVTNPAVKQLQQDGQARPQQKIDNSEKSETIIVGKVLDKVSSEKAYAKAERFSQDQQTFYDQPDGQVREALHAYQSLQTEQKREEVRALMGVDIYA